MEQYFLDVAVIGGADGPTAIFVASKISGLFLMIGFILLLDLAFRIFLGLAVYYDAKNRGNNEAVLWGVLVGIFELIPGIIYLCLRDNARNRLIVCQNCGFTHRIKEPICPKCNATNPYAVPFSDNPLAEQQAQRAKTFLIISVILFVVIIFVSVFFGISFMRTIITEMP